MRTKNYKLPGILLLALVISISSQAEDLRKIVSLSGTWKFSIGDDIQWASPSFDDSDWDPIRVPGNWEDQGYNEYNGYAWYRKKFSVAEIPSGTTIYLVFGRIDDADVVYLNGKLLAKSGNFPPEYESAYNSRRKYVIPAGFLKENAVNTIAIKVYDSYLEGGLIDAPAGIYTDADNDYLSLNLNGRWKFRTGNSKDWKESDFKDDGWKTIQVPSEWESQGYADYDGYAWYRVRFRLPKNFASGEYYLSLGKVDDEDDVYLNGQFIGTVFDLKKTGEYRHNGMEWNARRLYKIPEGLLIRDGLNTLAVKVYDGQQRGGIYEGPVGLMSAENCKRYKNKYYQNRSVWDYWYDRFVDEW